MPIVNVPPNLPELPPDPIAINARISDVPFKTNVVDSKVTSFSALLTHISGMSWIVTYYSQVLGLNDSLKAYDPTTSPTYQQYHRINAYELKLQGALDPSHDTQTNESTLTGTATLYPFLKPNVGDALFGDIGDGQTGQFTVTAVTEKTLLRQTCYEISFTLARYVTPTIQENISEKVVKDTYFYRDFMIYGQNPIVATDDYNALMNLRSLDKDIIDDWLYEFFSNEHTSIIVPGQSTSVYDPYVLKALMMLTDAMDNSLINQIKQFNCQDRRIDRYMSVWDALMNQSGTQLRRCFRKYNTVSGGWFSRAPLFGSARYCGVGRFVIPGENDSNVDSQLVRNSVGAGEPLENSYVVPDRSVPGMDIPVQGGEYYIFSEAFYTGVGVVSQFEHLVKLYMSGGAVDYMLLYNFCNTRLDWGPLERFYLSPVLVVLLRYALRGL